MSEKEEPPMKLNSVRRNLVISIAMLLGNVQLANATGNFIPYPINCTAIDYQDKSIEIQVSIVNKNGVILGHLQDTGDQATLECHEVPAQDGTGYNHLDCAGKWTSDGSDATLSTPLFTYAPMTTIQRSSSSLGNKVAQGVCF